MSHSFLEMGTQLYLIFWVHGTVIGGHNFVPYFRYIAFFRNQIVSNRNLGPMLYFLPRVKIWKSGRNFAVLKKVNYRFSSWVFKISNILLHFKIITCQMRLLSKIEPKCCTFLGRRWAKFEWILPVQSRTKRPMYFWLALLGRLWN